MSYLHCAAVPSAARPTVLARTQCAPRTLRGVGACPGGITDMCPYNGHMRPDRNLGRPGGECQVTTLPGWRAGHTGHVRHADVAARPRYSREDAVERAPPGRTQLTRVKPAPHNHRRTPSAGAEKRPWHAATAAGISSRPWPAAST